MPSPFPGMDPYLEDPHLWPDFHNNLAATIRSRLNHTLPDAFFAQVEVRMELGIVAPDDVEPIRWRPIKPDVAVTREPRRSDNAGGVAMLEAPPAPRREISPSIELEFPEPQVRSAFVEIREAKPGYRLVTLIEILSPSNKRPGLDREKYLAKQRDILNSMVHLVEIDLLRDGERPLSDPGLALGFAEIEPRPDFAVFVNAAWQRTGRVRTHRVYPAFLRAWLPCVGVPLREDLGELPLDLQDCFDRVYDDGPYRRGAIDYSQPPKPPWSADDLAWAMALPRR